ncbi:hypothetical protein [Mesorhizobium sp. WSM3626]|uniref:hypothetical protein n=1 Tax=Mesorhizobium sp. WSM3626 TaxID=1040987 RepID=UPI000489D0C2|nr:hypothetical protein [Mesorhizobium sp. WSM3626]
MNQAEFIRRARERAAQRQQDGFEERVASRTPEQRARVAAAYERFCREHAASKHPEHSEHSEHSRAHARG